MCSGSEAGSYLRLKDFVYHSTLGLRVIKKKKNLTRKSVRKSDALLPDCPVSGTENLHFVRCRANVAHARQSRPDSGLGSLVKVLTTF